MSFQRFDDIFLTQKDEKKYQQWRSKFTTQLQLPLEYPVTQEEIVPFISPDCTKNKCIFDKIQIAKEYFALNDPDETIDLEEEFECPYCEEDIKMKNMITSDKLKKEIYDLIGKEWNGIEPSSLKDLQLKRSMTSNRLKTEPKSVPNLEEYLEFDYDNMKKEFGEDPDTNFEKDSEGNYIFNQFVGAVKLDYPTLRFYLDDINSININTSIVIFCYLRSYIYQKYGRRVGIYIYHVKNQDAFNPEFEMFDTPSYVVNDAVLMSQIDSNIIFFVFFMHNLHHVFVYNKFSKEMSKIDYGPRELNQQVSYGIIRKLVDMKFPSGNVVTLEKGLSGLRQVDIQNPLPNDQHNCFVFYYILAVYSSDAFEQVKPSLIQPNQFELMNLPVKLRWAILRMLYNKEDSMKPIVTSQNKITDEEPPKPEINNEPSGPKPNPPDDEFNPPDKGPTTTFTSGGEEEPEEENPVDPQPEEIKSPDDEPGEEEDPSSGEEEEPEEEKSVSGEEEKSYSGGEEEEHESGITDLRQTKSYSKTKSKISSKKKKSLIKLPIPTSDSISKRSSVKEEDDKPESEKSSYRSLAGKTNSTFNMFSGKPDLNTKNLKNFQNFYSLLWYYYYYDKPKYKRLWKEYERQFSQIILKKVGIDPKILADLYGDKVVPEDQNQNAIPPPRPAKRHLRTFLQNPNEDAYIQSHGFTDRSPVNFPDMSPINRVQRQPTNKFTKIEPQQIPYNVSKDSVNSSSSHNDPPVETSFSSSGYHTLKRTTESEFLPQLEPPKNLRKSNSRVSFKPKKKAYIVVPDKQPSFNITLQAKQNPSKDFIMRQSNSSLKSVMRKSSKYNKPFKISTSRSDKLPPPKEIDKDDRIMKMHRENVQKFPELYKSRSNLKLELKESKANLFNDDLKELNSNSKITENMLNYFLKYLEKKQKSMDQDVLSKYNLKSYFFTTSFYRLYVGDLEKKYFATKYENVKHDTKFFKGEGNTIFDKHQKIIFPIVEKVGGWKAGVDSKLVDIFKLVLVDTTRKEIIFYDSMRPKLQEIDENGNFIGNVKENKHVAAVASYIEQEIYDKSYLNENVFDHWLFKRGECTQTDNDEMTGLFVCYYVYVILKGLKQPFFNDKELMKFSKKVKTMVSKAQR